ncbi:MAG: methyltransferase domain-containing protein [Actinobacteria bacterium]|nr:MAG: methyltransferase domain-containing protein [Actinomycetota bacterium]
MAAASARSTRVDFGPLAASYDRLRPVDENWRELQEVILEEGDFAGRRVLEVGCGTGRLAAALAERGARVWGVDPSEEMLAQAREIAGRGVGLKLGRAEDLPFRDGWFERALMRLVLHHLDRPRAFAELGRVLAPGGRLVVATFDPASFAGYWLNRFFPPMAEIDEARFPGLDELRLELEAAGFTEVRCRRLSQRSSIGRREALERIKGRYISTLRLLDDETFAAGLAQAEAELPATSEIRVEWLVVAAGRP